MSCLVLLRCFEGRVRGCVWIEWTDRAQTGLPFRTCAPRHTPRPDWSLDRLLHHSGDDEEGPRIEGNKLIECLLAGFKIIF